MLLSTQTIDRIQLLALAYISVWTVSPPLGYGDWYRYLLLISMVSWGAAELIRRDSIFTKPSMTVLLVLFYFLYVVSTNAMVDGVEGLIRNIQTFMVMIFILFYEGLRRRDFAALRPLLYLYLILHPVWVFATLNALSIDPHAARHLVRSSELAEEYSRQGVGGFALVYSALLSIPLYLYLLFRMPGYSLVQAVVSMRMKSLGQYALLLVNLLLSILLVIKAGFSMAVIGLGLVSFLFGISCLLRTNRPSIVLAASAAITLIAILVAVPLLDYFAGVSQDTKYFRKVLDIRVSMEEGDAVGTLEERLERYTRSIKLAVRNPVLGDLSVEDVGKHSVILDHFAQYGFIIGSVFAYLLWRVPFRGRVISYSPFNTTLAFAIAVIFLSLLNNVFSAFGFILFILFPVVLTYRPAMETAVRLQSLPGYPRYRPG